MRIKKSGLIAGRSIAVAVLLAACSVFALGGCSAGPGNDGTILAVAGENFYGDLISELGGNLVSEISLLDDPNLDPHTYESSSDNARAVADASLVVYNGLGYDAFVEHLLAVSPRPGRQVLDAQTLLKVPDGANPHLWYNPVTMPALARAVAGALEQLRPADKSTFEANLKTYLATFAPLSAEISSLAAKYPGLAVAYTEPVPGYLLDALGWRSLTPEGFARAIEDGTDPAPSDVAAMQDLFTRRSVKILLYNSQATSPATEAVKSLAGGVGIPVVGVSETISSAGETFVAWQLSQLEAIDLALGGAK